MREESSSNLSLSLYERYFITMGLYLLVIRMTLFVAKYSHFLN